MQGKDGMEENHRES